MTRTLVRRTLTEWERQWLADQVLATGTIIQAYRENKLEHHHLEADVERLVHWISNFQYNLFTVGPDGNVVAVVQMERVVIPVDQAQVPGSPQ